MPRDLLRTAFFETYGLNLPDIIGTKQTSIFIYRYAVRRFLPNIARAETLTIRNSDFIAAVKLQGASTPRIILGHVVPLCLS